MTSFPTPFLWGAAAAPHQIEGNNVNSDWWLYEQRMPHLGLSGDAVDSYHRYAEDMRLLADAGLTAYRFGIEWARVEPLPGEFSRAELAHYRRMIDTAIGAGLTPVVTLHHFTSPRWFVEEGGWHGDTAIRRFTDYVTRVTGILDGVEWICTINEPNMLALMVLMARAINPGAVPAFDTPTVQRGEGGIVIPRPTLEIGHRLVDAHHAARAVLKERTSANVGWTVANLGLWAKPENAEYLPAELYAREDLYLEGARGDDFIGVQSYSTQEIDAGGMVPAAPSPDNTLTGAAYRPDALGITVRHAVAVTGAPVLVTENGIATADDERRIAYTTGALHGLRAAIADGVDVRGYLHWSALDNFEWGHWEPTFGLIAVDRDDFTRHPKPSLAWLGGIARGNGANLSDSKASIQP
ncbi:beta-glucosidase [Actinoplanes lutulentus]|uniref:Aryl-beta-glucosidase n=1 Tax=Actinoplanes lutulentus TaxID=1287878 RepID=A0A327YZE0_9ACTN|nr:family 1 glycosylhydrolase [Actinoplanes lutulentus]MBB2946525.1 beta-glucosidase [Actinoplanes lutulentus]RAK26443.1 aryl-beta-glucosidase [Actinoplanes lutulentus]